MSFSAKILADSINVCGNRLTTFELTYPRCIHSEFMTHREFSRNAASSRAIPAALLIQRVVDEPFIPLWWGRNERGMQARAELDPIERDEAISRWLQARDTAVMHARGLTALGLHKQIVNRIIEPFMWITVIASTTSMTNFRGLRVHPDAEPHFQKIAGMACDVYDASTPKLIKLGEWHRPLIFDEDRSPALVIAEEWSVADLALRGLSVEFALERVLTRVSVARCGRVSYLTHEGKRDLREDLKLYDKLAASRPLHASPLEHAAYALDEPKRVGNFTGWYQHRKQLADEYIGGRMP